MPLQEPLDRNRRGREAEAHARRFLEARGLKTLATNYRTRWGEIDLVMEQAGTLVFVEVRTRVNNSFGGAAASVKPASQSNGDIRPGARFVEAGARRSSAPSIGMAVASNTIQAPTRTGG